MKDITLFLVLVHVVSGEGLSNSPALFRCFLIFVFLLFSSPAVFDSLSFFYTVGVVKSTFWTKYIHGQAETINQRKLRYQFWYLISSLATRVVLGQ